MISAWHLLWIIPLTVFVVVAAIALVRAGEDEEK